MKELIEENYKVTVKRGLINKDTGIVEFMNKLDEEVGEFVESIDNPTTEDATAFELADIILVCLNIAKHYEIDIEKYLNQKVLINSER